MKRKSLLLIAMTVVLATVINLFAGIVAFADGATTPEVVEIDTVEELKAVKNNLAGNYKLTANIDLGGEEWIPIGSTVNNNSTGAFTGVFDGNGYSVYNFKMTVTDTGDQCRYGFFGSVNGGTVKNLRIAQASYVSNSNTLGSLSAIVGFMYSGTISGCETAADVTITINNSTGSSRSAGICGYVFKGTVEYCVNRATVTGNTTKQYFNGGIAGAFANGTISYCINYGTINCTADGNWAELGGICGQFDNWTAGTSATITNCINYGTITNGTYKDSGAGGIVGQCKGTQSKILTNNINLGTVHTTFSFDVDDSAEELYEVAAQMVAWQDAANAPSTVSGNYGLSGEGCLNFGQQKRTNDTNMANSRLKNGTTLTTAEEIKATDTYKAIVTAVNEKLGISTDLYGYQTTKANEGKFDLRLVATLSGDYTKLTNVGFKVEATYTGLDGKKETVETVTKLYNSITATSEGEETATEHTATSLGGDYIFVLACKGIPADAQNLTFTVTTFYTATDAQTSVYSEVETFSVTVPNDTLQNG